ncbi:MAG: ammonium transporter [Candidatus Bathyarchaeota archaeon]|nr:ammonium transporter [Candidatus Bathyarchaeota archaeon]
MKNKRILSKASTLLQSAIEKHSTVFMTRKFYVLAGILATCVALSLGSTFAQTTEISVSITAINMAWTLAMGALVWFMQLGFAYFGAGLLRTKNQVNYWTKSYLDFSVGVVVFALIGFGLMFGGSGASFPTGIDAAGEVVWSTLPGLANGNAFIGYSGFGLAGETANPLTLTFFFWQAVFAATTVTIVAGMVAERMKIQAYLFYTVLINILIYPIYGHWMWGGGWLATLPFGVGARDFAGSSVVHAVGAFTGLAGAMLLGPRIGKFGKDGKPRTFPYTNIPYIVAGTMILFLGWFGFNPGSTLGTSDFQTATIAVNTYLAGGIAATVAAFITLFDKKHFKGLDIAAVCTAALGGLVAITAPCAFVAPWAAMIIGIIAAPIAIYGNFFIERVLKVDDPVGAFGVHGFNGLFGMLAVGLFADGSYGGVQGILVNGAAGGGQLIAQLIAMGTVSVFAFGMGLLVFGLIKYTIGLRAPPKDEIEGLDRSEHGFPAYPELQTKSEAEIGEPQP